MNAAAAAAGTVSLFKDLRKSTEGALDRAKLVFNREPNNGSGGGDNNENDGSSVGTGTSAATPKTVDRLEELSEYCPQLTFQQRLIGFAASFSLGCEWLLSLIFFILSSTLTSHFPHFMSLVAAPSPLSRCDCLFLLSLFHSTVGRPAHGVCPQLYIWTYVYCISILVTLLS
jgi:hypothetical protein